MLYNLVKILNLNDLVASGYSISHDAACLYARNGAHAIPHQGWKIHLSMQLGYFIPTIQAALPVLTKYNCTFKVPITKHALLALLYGDLDYLVTGKIVTVYLPVCNNSSVLLAQILTELENNIPRTIHVNIPTDIQYKNTNIYLRYGAYTPHILLNNSGYQVSCIVDNNNHLVPDIYKAGSYKPEWVKAPKVLEQEKSETKINKRQLSISDLGIKRPSLIRRNAGISVFDVKYNEINCILKVGTYSQLLDDHSRSAISHLANETHILNQLQSLKIVPIVVSTYSTRGAYLLLEEKINGTQLSEYFNSARRSSTNEVNKDVKNICLQLLGIMKRVHSEHIAIRDFSPNNIIIDESGCCKLIDLELATAFGNPIPFSGGTPGYFNPTERLLNAAEPASDMYALGAMFYFLSSSVTPWFPERLESQQEQKFYGKLNDVLKLSASDVFQNMLGKLGIYMMEHPETSISRIHSELSKLSVKDCKKFSSPLRLGKREIVHYASKYIKNQLNKFDFKNDKELTPPGLFRRKTGYLSLNEGICGFLVLSKKYITVSNDASFNSGINNVLEWINRVEKRDHFVFHNLVNGDIELVPFITWWIRNGYAGTNEKDFRTMARFILTQAFNTLEQMDDSLLFGKLGVAYACAEDIPVQSDTQCRELETNIINAVLSATSNFLESKTHDVSISTGLAGYVLFINKVFEINFEGVHFSKLEQARHSLNKRIATIEKPALGFIEGVDGALLSLSLSKKSSSEDDDIELNINTIWDSLTRSEYLGNSTLANGTAGKMLVAEAMHDADYVKKCVNILMRLAKVDDGSPSWTLPNQIAASSETLLTGNKGILFSLLKVVNNLDS